MPRIFETPGEVLFEEEYDTLRYKVYSYSYGPKKIKIYLPIDRARGLQGFKAIVSVDDDNNIESTSRKSQSLAEYEHQTKMEDLAGSQITQLIGLNEKFEQLIESVRVAPNNPANAKPKRKYTRRKATKKRVKK